MQPSSQSCNHDDPALAGHLHISSDPGRSAGAHAVRGAGEGERRSLMHHLVACFSSWPRASLPPQPVVTPLVCAYYPSKGCRLKSVIRSSGDPRGGGCESDVMDGQGGELLLGLRLFHVALFLPWLRTGSAHPLKELRSPCAFVFAGSPAVDLLRVSVATRNPRWPPRRRPSHRFLLRSLGLCADPLEPRERISAYLDHTLAH